MRRALFCCGIVGAFAAAPALAQEGGDRARLDDFALPSAAQTLPVEQLTSGDKLPAAQQHADRTLATPPSSEPDGAMPTQLSTPGAGGTIVQLAKTSQSRTALTGSVADPKDRPPGAVARIGGRDRCDPQAVQKVYAECLRILELRSEEFDAPHAPTLSAEQRLLAEQRRIDEAMTASTTLRLRLATGARPDAELVSNQELAAVYFTEPESPAVKPEPDPKASEFSELIQQLGLPQPTTGD